MLVLGLIVAAASGLAGCAERPPEGAVARVGPEYLLSVELDERVIEAVGVDTLGGEIDPRVLSSLLDQLVEERLLWHLALERGLVEPEADRRAVVAALLRAMPEIEPPDEAVERRWLERRHELGLPQRVRLRQVLVDERETAERLRGELVDGGEFTTVARRHVGGEGPIGAVAELARDDLPEGFAEPIFALEAGEVSPVIEARYGYHVFQVLEHLPGREPSFEEVAPTLRRELREERARDHLAELVEEARERYTVAVYAAALSFEYSGDLPTDSR